MLPMTIHDDIFYYPSEPEVSRMLDTTPTPRAPHNWYKIGTNLHYGRLRPEFVEWLEVNGPYEFKTVSATNVSMVEFFTGISHNIHKRFQVRLCHEEAAALFKLTWL